MAKNLSFFMTAIPIIDTSWHPLANGYPPEWASGWGIVAAPAKRSAGATAA